MQYDEARREMMVKSLARIRAKVGDRWDEAMRHQGYSEAAIEAVERWEAIA